MCRHKAVDIVHSFQKQQVIMGEVCYVETVNKEVFNFPQNLSFLSKYDSISSQNDKCMIYDASLSDKC